jgi:phosphoglycolate phosphatase
MVTKEEMRQYKTQALLQKLGLPAWQLPLIVSRARKAFSQNIHQTPIYPGVRDMLIALKQQCSLGILTSNSKENVDIFLENHRLDMFDSIHAGSAFLGKARCLKRFLNHKHLLPKEVLYVGDETRDIEAAKKAGIPVVAVCWGYHLKETLAQEKPDFLISDPREIFDCL